MVSKSSTDKPTRSLLIGLILIGSTWVTSEKTAIAWRPVQYSSQVTGTVNQPNPSLSQNALSITFDDQFPYGRQGMRLVRVTIATYSQLPVLRDQDFTICFDPTHRYNRVTAVNYFKHITIPAGSASVTAEMYISPNLSPYDQYRMTIGRGRWNGLPPNRQRVMSHYISGGITNPGPQRRIPTLLISSAVDSTLGVRKFIADRGENQGESIYSTRVDQALLPNLNGLMQFEIDSNTSYQLPNLNEQAFHACHPDDLPSSWLGLSSIERIFIAADELEDLIENSPFHRLTINSWLAAGGALVVLKAGDSVDQFNPLLTRLTAPLDRSTTPPAEAKANIFSQRKWTYPATAQIKIADRLIGVEIPQEKDNNYYYPSATGQVQTTDEVVSDFLKDENVDQAALWSTYDVDPSTKTTEDPFPAFMLTDHNRGQVVMVSADTDTWNENDWRKLTNAIQLQGIGIRGLVRSNQQAYDKSIFAIEGVGEPPLVLFQILMTLFVIIAGPVVFIVLKRTRNLQLMFLIVPIISLTACLGMVGNAIFLEGFGSLGRVDSVTWLDHRTDSVVSQVRACYYHGRTPGDYQFFQDTLPMDLGSSQVSNSRSGFRAHLMSDGTTIGGGDIQSRTPHQIVSLRSYQHQQGQQLLRRQENDQAIGSFQNSLGTDLHLVITKHESGWAIAEDLADGQSVPAQVISEQDLRNKLNQLANKLSPHNYTRFQTGYRNRYGGYYSSQYSPSLSPTPARFGGEFDVVSALRTRDGWQELVAENGYLAIGDGLPGLDRQLADSLNPEYKHQFHVVIGKW